MINARRAWLDVQYNNQSLGGQIASDIEDLSYTDSGADESDSISVTIDAQDRKWLGAWMPAEGSVLYARVVGAYWKNGKGRRNYPCGFFIVDDMDYQDAPSTWQLGGVSKPSNTDFSDYQRDFVWKNTTIKTIGQTIAARYNLQFAYDGDDYPIESEEQQASDSSFYNTLCKTYGLIMKVYALKLWVFDREKYKEKPPVKIIGPSDMDAGSFSYKESMDGSYTGGYFAYTDPDKNIDITCSVGITNGTVIDKSKKSTSTKKTKKQKHKSITKTMMAAQKQKIKNVNHRATSTQDAAIQLCAAINNANHGKKSISFNTDDGFGLSAGNTFQLIGFGKISGKYYVDKVNVKYSATGGVSWSINASRVEKAFHYWEVGGDIKVQEATKASTQQYTAPANNAASSQKGVSAGESANLNNAPFYVSSTASSPATHKTGTYYFYDGILISGRYRMTNTKERCGKLPVGKNVTGWVPQEYVTS